MTNANTYALQEQLDAINKKLPPAINATMLYNRGNPTLQFAVRYEQRGKKHSLGTFLTVDGALTALFEHKYRGMVKISDSELAARTLVIMNTIEKIADTRKLAAGDLSGKHETSMEKITELLDYRGQSTMPFACEGSIDMMDEAGNLFTLSKDLQNRYMDWLQKGFGNPYKVTAPTVIAVVAPILSDDEYNKMMGLDDEET